MNKKVFVTRKIPDLGIDMLKAKGYEVDIYPGDSAPTQKQIIKYLKKKPYDAVVTLLTDCIDAKVFDAVPTAKIFANYAVGFDNIDLEEAKKRGITVTNTPGNYSICVAEHAIALMLGLTTRMVEADSFTKKGRYKGWSPNIFIGSDLTSKTLGLIGAGRIGEKVAIIASKGFGMNIIYCDIKRNESLEENYGARFIPMVEEVLREADVVSLHVPLLDSTHHLMDASRLKMMKKTAFLINTSRGPVVDEKALVKALQEGVIAGAGLDVYEFEPKLVPGLVKLSNTILTPHIASARESARNEMARLAAQNVIDFFDGKIPSNKV
ncbi:MAG: D-glycerate dehydrogenase [Parcubacteria group bacterium]|nr:D-glycerate dehydrogenase [Parcubacteria group bacterium]